MSTSIETILSPFKAQVRTLAHKHAPPDRCAYCVEKTPLTRSWVADVPEAREFDAMVTVIEENLRTADYNAWWVGTELSDEYLDAYYEACAPADNCTSCRKTLDTAHECGHASVGMSCPLQGCETDR